MPSITIKDLPPTVLERLKARASPHRRSLNLEVIACLEAITHSTPIDPEALPAEARTVRRTLCGAPLTDRLLTKLKRNGLP
jgi:plasmid stability protein